jgi:putative flippase GtrA
MLARSMHRDARPQPHRRSRSQGRVAWFVAVGCVAAAVHWSVVVALVSQLGARPLVANVFGWLVALVVSFSGHHRLTFREHGSPVVRSAARFVAVSAGGFAVNETAYALLLQASRLRYDVLLAGVLLAVAVATYLLSRHWVFLRSPTR